MKYFILFISFTLFISDSRAQLIIRGSVVTEQQETIPGATIQIANANIAEQTQADGSFNIVYNGNFPVMLITSYTGYISDTLIINNLPDRNLLIKLKKVVYLKQVEVTSRKENVIISTITPINTTTITQQELLKAACCNLSESFETNPTIDVNYSDAITGARQIQMLGLDGIYSQIQFENLPLIFGLSSSYGLNFTPGPWIESIQINKGAGSVINGYEAITGQINIELKKPQRAEKFFINGYLNNESRKELNAQFAHRFKKYFSTILLTHGSINDKKTDHNNDGFLDQPLTKQANIFNAWHLSVPNKLEGEFGIRALYEERNGGQTQFNYERDFGKSTFYGVGIKNKLIELFTKTGTINPSKPYKSIALLTLSRLHIQNNFFGNNIFEGNQKSFHANTIYQTIIHDTRHYIRSGISFRYNRYDEKFNNSRELTNEIIPGAYAEYSFNNDQDWAIVAGVRGDIHNTFGVFITPRLHIRYNIDQLTSVRLSAGKGWRTARIYAENTPVFVSSRTILIENLKPEVAWNMGFNFTRKMLWFGHDASFNADYYFTRFINQVVVDMDDLHTISFYNLKGHSYAHYIQGELNTEPLKNVLVRLGYKYNIVKVTTQGKTQDKALTPKDKALINLEYKMWDNKISYDATLKYTGLSRIPGGGVVHHGYDIKKQSERYITINLQLTYKLKKIDLYFGCENATNFTQHHPIVASDEPFSDNFDASLIWGPLMGRTFYGGFRLTIK